MTEISDVSTINTNQAASTASPGGSVSKAKSAESIRVDAKNTQNAAILQASLDVSLQSGNQPLSLVLQSAINGINELLKPQFGDNALQAAASQDNTPSGTAGRIVSISTGFYDQYKQQHAGEDPNTVLTNFMSTISKGFEQGAKEAQGILKGMGVLSGDIAGNIDKTLEQVRQGYADFESAQRAILSGTSGTSGTSGASN